MNPDIIEKQIGEIEDNIKQLGHNLTEVKTMVQKMSDLLQGAMGESGLITKHNNLSERHFQLERQVNERFSNMERNLIERLNEKADHKHFKAIETKVNRWDGIISAAVILMPVIIHFLSQSSHRLDEGESSLSKLEGI